MVDKQEVKEELYDTAGDEFDFDEGEIFSINANLTSPTSAKVGHFVVASDYRRQGYGSMAFEALLEVLQSEGVSHVTVEIQALENGTEKDPVMDFLREYNFKHIEPFDHHNWGRCVRARGTPSF